MSLADRIRQFAYERYVRAAMDNNKVIHIRAGDVHSDMGLESRMPSICHALDAETFQKQYGLELVTRKGPKAGSNVFYEFRARSKRPAAPNPKIPKKPDKKKFSKQESMELNVSPNVGKTLYLVSCVKTKKSKPVPAKDLYISSLFQKARSYVEHQQAPWFILSAEYGLVHPNETISPYEKTLNTMGVSARREWTEKVWHQLQNELEGINRVVFLAGAKYREGLVPKLSERKVLIDAPLARLSFGRQLQWLDGNLKKTASSSSKIHKKPPSKRREKINRLDDVVSFYQLLDVLKTKIGGYQILSTCNGKMNWPRRGVYFFFEPGESRTNSGEGLRIVRVGTHALNTDASSTLWERLRQHRGQADGRGNHRGSIFRGLVGEALIERNIPNPLKSWRIGSHATAAAKELGIEKTAFENAETPIEKAVTAYIGSFPFLWLAIDDEPGRRSDRGTIERNSIALLSNFVGDTLDAPSKKWLGHSSKSESVRRSGLWNQQHVDEAYDPAFLVLLARYIEQTSA